MYLRMYVCVRVCVCGVCVCIRATRHIVKVGSGRMAGSTLLLGTTRKVYASQYPKKKTYVSICPMYAYMYICNMGVVHMYECVYVCMHVCMYVYLCACRYVSM